MSVIVLDAVMRAKLLEAGAMAELRDEDGNLIGRFVAEPRHPDLNLTDTEVRRRLAPDARTYSTAEVLDHLRGLK